MTTNKQKILQAASELLLKKGPSGLSVRAIAARAGLSTIGIYSHFQGKQGILDALYIEGYEHIYRGMVAANTRVDPREAVLEATRNYLEVATVYEANYRLIFGEADANFTPSPEAIAVGEKAFEALIEVASKVLSPAASADMKRSVALRFWALVHGYTSLQHHGILDVIGIKGWEDEILASVGAILDSLIQVEKVR